MTDTLDTTKVMQEILAGRADDKLDDLAGAIAMRVKESMLTFAWRFRLDGVDVGELELTLDEWSEIQKATGTHLAQIQPETNVDHLLAIGRTLLRTRGGLSAEEASARIGSLTAADVPTVVVREVLEAPFGSST